MKKGIIVTIVSLLAIVLAAGITGCGDNSTAATTPPETTPIAAAAPPEVNVSLNTQSEGIWVSGTGKVAVTPDVALLRLGIEAQEASVGEAQAEASEAMDKVMAALKDSGVAEEDIQTQNFRIYQRTRWDEPMQDEGSVGYRVTNDIVAKIRDLEKTGDIIDAVVAAGGDYTRISDLNFSVDDPSAYYDEAREKAMDDARGKAEKIAGLAGMKLGEPTYINESASSSNLYSSYGLGVMAAPAPTVVIPTSAPISPGQVEITLYVQVAYKMNGKVE